MIAHSCLDTAARPERWNCSTSNTLYQGVGRCAGLHAHCTRRSLWRMTKRRLPTWAEPHDTKSHLSFATGIEFAQKLRTAMDQAGLTASDLARRIWGDAPPTTKGYVSAKNRDRISKYLAGKVVPEAATLTLIAEALHVSEKDLAPEVVGNQQEREHPEFRVTVIKGHPDRAHVTINTVLPATKVGLIWKIIYGEVQDTNVYTLGPVPSSA